MSVIIETVIALSTFLLLVSGGDYLAIFRGKSKHTSLISPFEGWTLPEYELKSSFGSKFDDRYYFDPAPLLIGKGNTFRRLKAHGEKFPSYSSTVSQSAAENAQLLFACQKCILLHGIYEIWSEGYSVEEVASKCETSVQYQSLLEAKSVINDHNSSDKLVSINVAASILEQPWLSTEQLKTDVLSKFDYLWQNVLSNQKEENSGTSNEIEVRSRKQKLSLDEQGLSEDFASLPMERSKLPAAGTAIELRIYQDETSGYCVLCRLLAKGLAAPSNSGKVHIR